MPPVCLRKRFVFQAVSGVLVAGCWLGQALPTIAQEVVPAVPPAATADAPAATTDAPPATTDASAAPLVTLPESTAAAPVPAVRARVLVLPVVIGDGPDPDPLLITSLVKGLGENPNWDVVSPALGDPLEPLPQPVFPIELLAQAEAALAAAETSRAANDHATVVAALEPIMENILRAAATAPLGAVGTALVTKLGGALLAAQAGAGLDDAATTTAANLKQLLPGRPLGQAEGFSLVASALIQATPPAGVGVQFVSNPKRCDVVLDGYTLGPAPVKVLLRPNTRYAARAECKEGSTVRESFVRTVAVAAPTEEAESAPTETAAALTFMLDAELPKVLEQTPRGTRLRFASAQDRRALEEAYVPRLAERFGANNVVLVSAGQFQSSEWLNARLYLSSGFKNRHGLARMEAPRASALGRYLSTGRESPGVLNAEEAGNMVAASQTLKPLGREQVEKTPWYDDVAGWSMLGAGAVAVAIGLWADGKGNDKRTEATLNTRDDPIRRDQLNSQASNLKFWGNVGIYGGAALAGAGLFLLILPEYDHTSSELYGLSPLPGGAAFHYSGRF